MRTSRSIPYLITFLVALLLYLPSLRTGFLTDDFLDCTHTFSEVPAAFTEDMAGGYRPLMVAVWASDNAVWGITRQWGWHLTNLLILSGCSVLLVRFLKCFVDPPAAVSAGLAAFLFSFPVTVAVARVSGRTTLLALIPFLLSAILAVSAVREKRSSLLWLSSFLYLVSLLFKETFLAAAPFVALAGTVAATEGGGGGENRFS